jgi:Mg2+-importing ATPase
MDAWWRLSEDRARKTVHAGLEGLTQRQAAALLRSHGPNRLRAPPGAGLLKAIASRLASPLVLILLVASFVSAWTGDAVSFGFIFAMVSMSIAVDIVQEHRAGRAVAALARSVALRVRVRRDGRSVDRPAADLVPGDLVELSAGDLVPADGRVLQATHFFVNQASLTGEAWPVQKGPHADASPADEALPCEHAVFMGSSVVTGSAQLLVCATGGHTELGGIARSLGEDEPPTSF